MPTKITAGGASDSLAIAGGNDGALTLETGPSGAKVNALAFASDGTPTFLKIPVNTAVQSMVRLHTAGAGAAGYGSTNTAIRRFTTTVVNQGSDITFADSATAGASATINTSGVYAISYNDSVTTSFDIGLSLNSSQLSTSILSITAANRLASTQTGGANFTGAVSCTLYLAAGDVVRPHCGVSPTAGTGTCNFTITRVA